MYRKLSKDCLPYFVSLAKWIKIKIRNKKIVKFAKAMNINFLVVKMRGTQLRWKTETSCPYMKSNVCCCLAALFKLVIRMKKVGFCVNSFSLRHWNFISKPIRSHQTSIEKKAASCCNPHKRLAISVDLSDDNAPCDNAKKRHQPLSGWTRTEHCIHKTRSELKTSRNL